MSDKLRSEVLSKILLMQNILGQLPDKTSMFEFVCRGITYLPGVQTVSYHMQDLTSGNSVAPETSGDSKTMSYIVSIQQTRFGEIAVHLGDSERFLPYSAYINNLCFMMAAVIEQQHRAAIEKDQKAELEAKVIERTKQLARQVVETQAAVNHAVAEKERAERYLEVSEAMIVELDTNANIMVINKRGAQLLGWDVAELIGKNWMDVAIPPEERQTIREVFDTAMRGERQQVEDYENELICRDGSRKYVVWHNVVVVNEDGSILQVVSSGVDITERKQAEKALAAEKERLSITLRGIADGVITLDNNGIVLTLNRAAENFTGWQSHEAVGKSLSTVYNATPIELGGSGGYDDENSFGASQQKLVSRSGQEVLVSHLQSPIYDRNSQKIGSVLVFRDITREHGLREHMERAGKLDSIGMLAGGIAHDFNNLLGGLFGYLELARESDDLDEVRMYLERSDSVYERARHLTGQLLTFAKGGEPMMNIGDVGKVVKDAAIFALSGANIRCRFQIDDSLRPVKFDEHQIAQVIDNIVINAKQAMVQSGEIEVVIENCRLNHGEHPILASGDYVRISVADSGVGIPPSLLNRIFEPFLTTKQDGSGLGLATSYAIVRKHGGTIDVTSEVDHGSVFHVWLPVTTDSLSVARLSFAPEHSGSGKVLVLDDEQFNRDVFSAMLSSLGYDVESFADGKEVLAYMKNIHDPEQLPVAAFFDLTIPGGIGGEEIVDAVRAIHKNMVIVAASGYSAGDIMAHPVTHGFDASLPKPFRTKDLAIILGKHLP